MAGLRMNTENGIRNSEYGIANAEYVRQIELQRGGLTSRVHHPDLRVFAVAIDFTKIAINSSLQEFAIVESPGGWG
jgi:hypothetical protein